MKKVIFFISVFIVSFVLIMSFYKKTISVIPNSSNILNITLSENTTDKTNTLSYEQSKNIIALMNKSYSKLLKNESIDDVPRVSHFYTIKIETKDDHTNTFYVFKNRNKSYLEHPYDQIYFASDELIKYIDNIYKY